MTDAEALAILKDPRLRLEVNKVQLKEGYATSFCPFCEQYLHETVHSDQCEYRQLLRYISESREQNNPVEEHHDLTPDILPFHRTSGYREEPQTSDPFRDNEQRF